MGWLKKNMPKLENASILIDSDDVDTDENGNFLIDVAYIRVSTDKQAEEGYGLNVQYDKVFYRAKERGVKNCILFTDDGYTGTNLDRPGINGIIELITSFNDGFSKLRINSIITPRLDRLSRSLLNTLLFIEDYVVCGENVKKVKQKKGSKKKKYVNHNKYEINFISVDESYFEINKNNPTATFIFVLFASLAEYDRNLIVQKLQLGRNQRIKSGKWHGGGTPPFGYIYNKETGNLIVNELERDIVKEVFRLYIEEKKSPFQIANKLGFKGERIVAQMLTRKTYCGYVNFKDEYFKGEHEPIIDEETFEKAQIEKQSRARVHAESCYLLTGLLVCHECGAKMRYQKWGKTGDAKIVCYSRQKEKKNLIKDPNCDNELFWAQDIEDAVIKSILNINYQNEETVQKTSSFSTSKHIEARIQSETRELNKLYDLYSMNDDDDDILIAKIKEKKDNLQKLKQNLADEEKSQSRKKKLLKTMNLLRDIKSTWGNMTDKEKQTVCRELIEKVEIYKNGNVDVKLRAEDYLRLKK